MFDVRALRRFSLLDETQPDGLLSEEVALLDDDRHCVCKGASIAKGTGVRFVWTATVVIDWQGNDQLSVIHSMRFDSFYPHPVNLPGFNGQVGV